MTISGKVVHYDANRGFGFLAPDSGGADVFLHINDLDIDENSLKPGAKVEFDIEETDRGAKATNVAVTEEAHGDDGPPSRPHRRDSHDHGRSHGDRDRGDRPRRSRGHAGSAETSSFTEEVTELLLDASGDLTAAQILAIRSRLVDLALGRGWIE